MFEDFEQAGQNASNQVMYVFKQFSKEHIHNVFKDKLILDMFALDLIKI